MPSVLVMPTRRPFDSKMRPIRRLVVVLPLVPAMATTGMRALSPSGNIMPTMASPTARPLPKEGARCMRRPGAALTSTMPPPCSSSGLCMVSQTTSMPAMSRPTVCAAATAAAASSGWTSSVTSVAVPPVDRLALLRSTTRTPRGGDQLVAAAQEAPVVARQETLDHDGVAELDGDAVGLADLFLGRQVDRDALALVAILRLDDDRQADFLGGDPGVVLVFDRPAIGHGNAGRVQQLLCQFLVLGDR